MSGRPQHHLIRAQRTRKPVDTKFGSARPLWDQFGENSSFGALSQKAVCEDAPLAEKQSKCLLFLFQIRIEHEILVRKPSDLPRYQSGITSKKNHQIGHFSVVFYFSRFRPALAPKLAGYVALTLAEIESTRRELSADAPKSREKL